MTTVPRRNLPAIVLACLFAYAGGAQAAAITLFLDNFTIRSDSGVTTAVEGTAALDIEARPDATAPVFQQNPILASPYDLVAGIAFIPDPDLASLITGFASQTSARLTIGFVREPGGTSRVNLTGPIFPEGVTPVEIDDSRYEIEDIVVDAGFRNVDVDQDAIRAAGEVTENFFDLGLLNVATTPLDLPALLIVTMVTAALPSDSSPVTQNFEGASRVTIEADIVGFSVIPLPASAWLFGSALGLLGWLKRRAV